MKILVQNLFLALTLLTTLNLLAEESHSSKLLAGIPFERIGAVADKQYSGPGLAVVSSPEGAQLQCVFQRLNGRVTAEGLWLTSMADGAKNQPFRVVAGSVGRDSRKSLLLSGKVEVDGQVARFVRPGLTEEYTVSMDGVRQDFIIEQRPKGTGPARLELMVDGAKAEAMAGGARLVLADRGRELVYNRLKVEDARGRELPAKMEVLSTSRMIVAIDDAAAEYPVRIDPTFSDANWVSLAGLAGVNNTVDAAVVDGAGNLYIGGAFTIVGNMFITNLAEWNGSSWSAVGSGVNGAVNALLVSGGNLYAGGSFTTAGGNVVNHIAVWNGSTWSALGLGLNNTVFALTISGGNLYAGGFFTMATNAGPVGISASHIAEWNGSSWSALGIGLNSTVLALATLGTNVVVGGQFTFAGFTPAVGIAQWNGTTWLTLAGGVNSSVNSLAVSGTNLFAGGNFTVATNSGPVALSTPYIAEWNGNSWTNLALGLNNTVESLLVSGANLFAGGYITFATNTGPVTVSTTLIAEWNGSSWSALGTGVGATGGAVNALVMWGGNLIAGGGAISRAGTVGANNLAQWNGASWSPVVPGLNSQVQAVAVMGTNLFIGGNFQTAGNVAANYIAQWNGSGWSTLGTGMNSQVSALAVMGTNLYAGGFFTTAGSVAATNIAMWNGNSWTALGTGVGGWLGFWPPVSALAVWNATNLVVGGEFNSMSGVAATNIAIYNASGWFPVALGVGPASVFPNVNALVVQGNTNIYVGGNFAAAYNGPVSVVNATNIAEINFPGVPTWSALGLGVGSQFNGVNALAMFGTNLIAGGSFTMAGGVAATNIAQWNGSSWSAMGLGVNGAVNALAVSDTNLYVGGSFTKANGNPANYLARWDGNNWSPVGTGMNNSVYTLTTSGNALFAGGNFTIAGGRVSAYVAEAITNTITWLSIQAGVPGPNENTLTYSGIPNFQHVVLYKTNLLTGSWIPLVTNIPGANGVGMVQDPSATDPQRFYILNGP